MRLLFVGSVAATEHLNKLGFRAVFHGLLATHTNFLDLVRLEVCRVEELVVLPCGMRLELGNTGSYKRPSLAPFFANLQLLLLALLHRRLLLVQARFLVVSQHRLAMQKLAMRLKVQICYLALVWLIEVKGSR